MNKASYQDEYQSSLTTLEDILLLSELSMSPLINRAYFHLSEMKRKADQVAAGTHSNFSAVNKILDEKFECIISEFFGNQHKFKAYTFEKNTEKIELRKWNLILEIIPEILSVVSLFSYHGKASIELNDQKLFISGHIRQDQNLEYSRKLIYVITRKLLREKVLLTFKLKKSARNGLFKLDLTADISHDESMIYRVIFKPNERENYFVGFTNILNQYRANFEEISQMDEHHIIGLNHQLEVEHYYGRLDSSSFNSPNQELLHFPFLFRPVSIILPMKGSLASEKVLETLNSFQTSEQDVSNYYRAIDFFSLFT